MDPIQYPKIDVGERYPEHWWRDFKMFNLRINAHKMKWLKDAIDVIDAHRFMDHFCESPDPNIRWYFDVVEEGQGDASYDCVAEVNGVLYLVNDGADNDSIEATRMCTCWQLVDCYPLYAECRVRINDYIQSDFWFGFVSGTTWFTPPDDAVVFNKDDGDANIDFITRFNAAQTLTDTGEDFTTDEWIRLGIHWDGEGTVRGFVIRDGDFPQITLAAVQHTTHISQDTLFTLGFGIRNGEAAIKTLKIDYIKCAQKLIIE